MATKVMQAPVTWKRFTSDAIESYKGAPGEPIIDFRSAEPSLRICDGVTEGGHPVGGGGGYGVAIPQFIAPLNNATGVDRQPMITASNFNGITEDGLADVHVASYWSFYADAAMTNVLHESGRDTENLTAYDTQVLGVELPVGEMYVKVAYEGESGAIAEGPLLRFTTMSYNVGEIVDGDIVAGQYRGDIILVAPAVKRARGRRWGHYNYDVRPYLGTNHHDSVANTDALTTPPLSERTDERGVTGSPAADHCRSLGDDYHLPARGVIRMIARNRAQIDAGDPTLEQASSNLHLDSGAVRQGAWSSTPNGTSFTSSLMVYLDDPERSIASNRSSIAVLTVPVRHIPA